MAKIYAELIKKGFKTLDDVPERLYERVRALVEITAGDDENA